MIERKRSNGEQRRSTTSAILGRSQERPGRKPTRQTFGHRSTRWLLLAPLVLLILAISVLVPGSATEADTPSAIRPTIFGVNLPSGGFAPERLPGVHGTDYLYPKRETGAPFRAMGMNTVRIAFLWERLQPRAMDALDPAELKRLDQAIAGADGFEMVILDLHNYGRYHGRVLDPDDGSDLMLADFWQRMALRYGGSPRVAFGIMNEPHGIDAGKWRSVVNRTVAAIRATGARNLLLIPGTNWSGGHSWFEGGERSNAVQMAGFAKTDDNFAFEIHQYLDWNSSGQGSGCDGKTVGRDRLRAVTAWLRKEGATAILGEFGAGPSRGCLEALDDMLDYLDSHGDAWRGWVYWAGGEWWGDYPLSIQPDGDRQKPQAVVLKRHIRVPS